MNRLLTKAKLNNPNDKEPIQLYIATPRSKKSCSNALAGASSGRSATTGTTTFFHCGVSISIWAKKKSALE